MSSSLTAVVLAAGKGTRMKSDKAKVLHEVFFKPMVHHVLDAIKLTSVSQTAIIIGHQKEKVQASLNGYEYVAVTQEEQLGTGHAVLCAEQACATSDHVMILCGDTPLVKGEMLQALLEQHLQKNAAVTLLTTELANPFGYGRIIKDSQGNVIAIVEQKDASPSQQQIRDINAGIYVVEKEFLFTALHQVGTDNSQKEMYLTDIISIAVNSGRQVHNFSHPQAIDVLGVNSRVELAQAHQELKMRHNEEVLLSGVTMLHPQSITIAPDCLVGKDVLLHSNISITDATDVGPEVTVEPGCVLKGCTIEAGALIGANSVLENIQVTSGEQVPPLTYRHS
ncbi:MAG: glycosyl transferase family 2 [Desulfobulbus propionicus]|nr:MAG: glycosyl transferase family 2 [Desulfobulbus propionicus]